MLKGALVTIAMGTQREIAAKALEGGGDYCLALEENRPLLHADAERFFADPAKDKISTHTTTDGDHGRIEERSTPSATTWTGCSRIGAMQANPPSPDSR
jgi:hypothetical protein